MPTELLPKKMQERPEEKKVLSHYKNVRDILKKYGREPPAILQDGRRKVLHEISKRHFAPFLNQSEAMDENAKSTWRTYLPNADYVPLVQLEVYDKTCAKFHMPAKLKEILTAVRPGLEDVYIWYNEVIPDAHREYLVVSGVKTGDRTAWTLLDRWRTMVDPTSAAEKPEIISVLWSEAPHLFLNDDDIAAIAFMRKKLWRSRGNAGTYGLAIGVAVYLVVTAAAGIAGIFPIIGTTAVGVIGLALTFGGACIGISWYHRHNAKLRRRFCINRRRLIPWAFAT